MIQNSGAEQALCIHIMLIRFAIGCSFDKGTREQGVGYRVQGAGCYTFAIATVDKWVQVDGILVIIKTGLVKGDCYGRLVYTPAASQILSLI